MQKTIIVCGYGSGISAAVAKRFGSEGFQVALVARSAEKLEQSRAGLEQRGVKALAFPADLSDPEAAKEVVRRVRLQLGPVTAIQWNAYSNAAGDILSADAAALRSAYDIAVTSLASVAQEAIADLKAAKGALLVTNGGLGLFDANIDAMAVQWNSMGLAIANSAKHKLVGLLTAKLRAYEITVGEVVVVGLVKGTAWDTGNATVDPDTVAGAFWEMYSSRESKSVNIG